MLCFKATCIDDVEKKKSIFLGMNYARIFLCKNSVCVARNREDIFNNRELHRWNLYIAWGSRVSAVATPTHLFWPMPYYQVCLTDKYLPISSKPYWACVPCPGPSPSSLWGTDLENAELHLPGKAVQMACLYHGLPFTPSLLITNNQVITTVSLWKDKTPENMHK